MSADLTTVKEVIEELQKYPENMLVVGYGIDGWSKGEKLDGVNVYEHYVREGSDGFIPLEDSEENEINEREEIDAVRKVVVISPIDKDGLIEWCF